MDIGCHFIGQYPINGTLAIEARHVDKSPRNNFHPEMAFALWARSGMPSVQVRFVNDFQAYGQKFLL